MPAVRCDEPVALAVGRRRHADDRLVQMDGTSRSVEVGVTEREDAAVGRHHPVALTIGRGSYADDRLVQMDSAGRAVELGVTEGEDAAVGCHHPVAAVRGCRRHADDGLVQVHGGQVAEVVEEFVIAEPGKLPCGSVEVVPLPGRARRGIVGVGADKLVVTIGCQAIKLQRERLDRRAHSDKLVDSNRRRRAGLTVTAVTVHGHENLRWNDPRSGRAVCITYYEWQTRTHFDDSP